MSKSWFSSIINRGHSLSDPFVDRFEVQKSATLLKFKLRTTWFKPGCWILRPLKIDFLAEAPDALRWTTADTKFPQPPFPNLSMHQHASFVVSLLLIVVLVLAQYSKQQCSFTTYLCVFHCQVIILRQNVKCQKTLSITVGRTASFHSFTNGASNDEQKENPYDGNLINPWWGGKVGFFVIDQVAQVCFIGQKCSAIWVSLTRSLPTEIIIDDSLWSQCGYNRLSPWRSSLCYLAIEPITTLKTLAKIVGIDVNTCQES